MSYKITALPNFLNFIAVVTNWCSMRWIFKEAKRLSKKFPSLKKEIEQLIITLGVRLAISSKGAGKSGGARVITCVIFVSKTIYLLSIYDKSESSNTSQEIKKLLKAIPEKP